MESYVQEFLFFCDDPGIKRHLTAPYSPQKNGVVQRRNRTLMEMTRSIMKHMDVPSYLWGEVVRHLTYVINKIATRTLKIQTPYECRCPKKKKPNVEHLWIFGCICYAKNDSPHLRKLDDRSRTLIHLGIKPGNKAYRLYDPTKRKVVISQNVFFDKSRGWKWSTTTQEETCEPRMITFSVHNEKEESDKGENDNCIDDHDEEEEQEASETEDIEETDEPILRRSTRQSTRPSYLEDYVFLSELEDIDQILLMINEDP